MDDAADNLEQIWGDLLSQQPDVIQQAFLRLDSTSQQKILTHLQRMVNDPGWQPEQRESALIALQTIEHPSPPDE